MTLSSPSPQSRISTSGKSLFTQAESKFSTSKKSSISWWISALFSPQSSSETSLEKAAELFGQAANSFKIDKNCN